MNKDKEKIIIDGEEVKQQVEKRVRGVRKLIQEFKDFAMRGNMIDMAVGIVIGTAFTAMVKSIVEDTFLPLISFFFGDGGDYEGLIWHGIEYGKSISAIINFLILAAVVFAVVKAMNALSNLASKKNEEKDDVIAETELSVLEDIRELLKEQQKSAN